MDIAKAELSNRGALEMVTPLTRFDQTDERVWKSEREGKPWETGARAQVGDLPRWSGEAA